MGYCDGSVLLLTSSIPKLGFYRSTVFHSYVFGCKLNTNRISASLGQLVLKISREKARFPNKDVANQNNYILLAARFQRRGNSRFSMSVRVNSLVELKRATLDTRI